MILHVELELPPGANGGSANHGQYRPVVKWKRTPFGQSAYATLVLSPLAERWIVDAARRVMVARAAQGWEDPGGPLWARLCQFSFRDVDAGVKAALDAIATGLGIDDRRFRRVLLEAEESAVPRYLVEVGPQREGERCLALG